MALFTTNQVSIKGIAAAVPINKVFNNQLEGFSEEEIKKLIATVGIEERRVAPKELCASDLCVASAKKIISELNWKSNEIDAVFFVSQTPDYLMPGSSMHIAERLGLASSCYCVDINQGCAGYVYGMSMITSFMSSTKIKKALLLVGDTITKLVSAKDKSIVPIFSDAGTATALEYNEFSEEIVYNTSVFGSSYEAIMIRDGGGRKPITDESLIDEVDSTLNCRNGVQMRMQGMNVFTFSISKVHPNILELMQYTKLKTQEIDYFVFHQANKLIVDNLANKLKIENEKVPCSLKQFGNTSGASIPLTIVTEIASPTNNIDAKLFLSGFGVGLSVASAIVNFNGVICPPLIEL